MPHEVTSDNDGSDQELTNTEKWLSEFSKCAYEAYSKIDSANERTRTLTAPLTALGAGFIYQISSFNYGNSIQETLFFYIPIGIGAILTIASIYTILWALILKSGTNVLASPEEYMKEITSWGDNAAAEAERDVTKKRIYAATLNHLRIKQRCNLLWWGAIAAIAALTLLISATPYFVINQISQP